MNAWLIDMLGDQLPAALEEAARAQVIGELCAAPTDIDYELIERVAMTLEVAVLELLSSSGEVSGEVGSEVGSGRTRGDSGLDQVAARNNGDDRVQDSQARGFLQRSCADAYRLYRVLPARTDEAVQRRFCLHRSALAVLGELGADAARLLREKPWPELPELLGDVDWRNKVLGTVTDVWLRLIRKQGWADRDAVLHGVRQLRQMQIEFEAKYLQDLQESDLSGNVHVKAAALELVALYHLTKAAEVLALYVTDGVVEGKFQIHHLLDTHFDCALAVTEHCVLMEVEPLIRLLRAAARQLADNSIWTVTRAVNSRVTAFVQTLVERGRGDKALFDVLPPQRLALAEKGLLGSSRRAVVVSMPTSSGKTLIAQFRILQALNQFDLDRGWVAYLAPTRSLVRQIARRLTRDFEPLGVVVEQVSAVLEVDTVEAQLLRESSAQAQFRVLVTTPEKFDLMMRQGWETKIGRPLTLVVVDEAHNIQDGARGLKLELLLATINAECQRAQFLLLTPFVNNAREVARWLGDSNSEDVSFAIDWQPNDRVIGVVKPVRTQRLRGNSYDYHLSFDTVHTTRATLALKEAIVFEKSPDSSQTFSTVSTQTNVAAAAAHQLKRRGPVIVMHSRPDYVWSLAAKLKSDLRPSKHLSDDVRLVQDFLAFEMGAEFALIDLLSHRVGVHHAGLSDEIRALMEWLFEGGELDYLVATTTIAQGVNFPVSGVVMASHQYPYGSDMPPEDFWNLAGRAGRVDQASLGVVALAASDDAKHQLLREFIQRQTGELNSALIDMVEQAGDLLDDLGSIVFRRPAWSAFVQYLTHTYQQMGRPAGFADQIEQILRGTLGFGKLRASNQMQAMRLLASVRSYAHYLSEPGQPLKLVDSTGFSLQSVKSVMRAANREGIGPEDWNSQAIFNPDGKSLQKMMGVLLKVPELRENFNAALGKSDPHGQKLALILKDWVGNVPISEIAQMHFASDESDLTPALTRCGQQLHGRLVQTAAWGLGALLSITSGDIPDDDRQSLNGIASRVYYGVADDDAIALRLLGIPRMAAQPLAHEIHTSTKQGFSEIRNRLRQADSEVWANALGADKGRVYQKVWRVLEGLD